MQQRQMLELLSPQHWLQRGFVLMRDQRGALIRRITQITAGDQVSLQLADGMLQAEITSRQPHSPAQADTMGIRHEGSS